MAITIVVHDVDEKDGSLIEFFNTDGMRIDVKAVQTREDRKGIHVAAVNISLEDLSQVVDMLRLK